MRRSPDALTWVAHSSRPSRRREVSILEIRSTAAVVIHSTVLCLNVHEGRRGLEYINIGEHERVVLRHT